MIPVGKSCDCGYPLVWRDGVQWCSVGGTHPAPERFDAFVFRFDRSAPFAALVIELDGMLDPTEKGVRRRAAYYARRAVPAA
jgi:hypothetical protein